MPKTIDALREHDETTVTQVSKAKEGHEEEKDEEDEVAWDINNDEFKGYYDKTYEPKVLITSADNPKSVKQS